MAAVCHPPRPTTRQGRPAVTAVRLARISRQEGIIDLVLPGGALVDGQTRSRLSGTVLDEVLASLWPGDCQSCGQSLGIGPPALAVDELGVLTRASLHHSACRAPGWNGAHPSGYVLVAVTANNYRLGKVAEVAQAAPASPASSLSPLWYISIAAVVVIVAIVVAVLRRRRRATATAQ